MASQSASNAGGGSAAEVQQLKAEVKRLKAYKVMAEQNLQEMGLNLQAALRQGWVSKRAEVRRNRLERKASAEAAKWAKMHEEEAWIRKERKRLGLPVQNPTPSPSEAAYRERVADAAKEETAERLRNRVRRLSHQLLIAAAVRKQYREITMADHSGHFPPGTDMSGPFQHRAFDARSEASLSSTEAMARSFRNWANKDKKNRFRARSHSPETVVVSSRTTGPEDSSSGSSSDSSLTDDSAPPPNGPGIAGPAALRAAVYDPVIDEDSIIDAGEVLGGLADLDFDDVSDQIMATAYAMLTAAEQADGTGDWAETLAGDVLKVLLAEKPITPPSSPDPSLSPDPQKLAEGIKQALELFQMSLPTTKHKNTKGGPGNNKTSQAETEIMQEVKKALDHLTKQQPQQLMSPSKSPITLPEPEPKHTAKVTQTKSKPPKYTTEATQTKSKSPKYMNEATQTKSKPPKYMNEATQTKSKPPKYTTMATQTKSKLPKKTKMASELVKQQKKKHKQKQKHQKHQQPPPPSPPSSTHSSSSSTHSDDNKGPSQRAPHKPAAPNKDVYNPIKWWRPFLKEPYDGIWASKVLPPKQQELLIETGFVKWKEQEARFPRLDDRLELKEVYRSVIFKPETADTYSWHPLNRAITEPKTGARAPLSLGPVTMHSLAAWRAGEFGTEYYRGPIPMPDNPSVEDKKRPLSSTPTTTPKTTTMPKTMTTPKTTPKFTLSKPKPPKSKVTALQKTGGGGVKKTKKNNDNKNVTFASAAKAYKAAPTTEAPLASVHYPLKSPTATSISKSNPDGHVFGRQQNVYVSGATAVASASDAPRPQTPYPRYQPDTPSVALYEHDSDASSLGSEESSDEEQDKKLEVFLRELHGAGVPRGKGAANGKRTATEAALEPSSPTKMRQTSSSPESSPGYPVGFAGSSTSESGSEEEEGEKEQENGVDAEEDALEAVKVAWAQHESDSSENVENPFFPSRLHRYVNEGPSHGMRSGAKRALGRYGLTSSRRGQLGPYR